MGPIQQARALPCHCYLFGTSLARWLHVTLGVFGYGVFASRRRPPCSTIFSFFGASLSHGLLGALPFILCSYCATWSRPSRLASSFWVLICSFACASDFWCALLGIALQTYGKKFALGAYLRQFISRGMSLGPTNFRGAAETLAPGASSSSIRG